MYLLNSEMAFILDRKCKWSISMDYSYNIKILIKEKIAIFRWILGYPISIGIKTET